MSLYRIAGELFDIKIRSDLVRSLCASYAFGGEAAGEATPLYATDADIEYERSLEPRGYFGLYESTALYRKICLSFIEKNGFVFHSSALSFDGKGYLFTAVSGTGKSTHTALWRREFGDRVVMINDDKPIIRLENGSFFVYGTPWCGKEGINSNIRVPLHAIALLGRGRENVIERVTVPSQVFARLFNQTYRPGDALNTGRLLDLFARLLDTVPVYDLKVNMDPSAAHVAADGMKG